MSMKTELLSHKNERSLYDFHGGIHPEENKWQSTQETVQSVPLPATLYVPIQQHSGKPAKIIVSAGEHVLKGQLIAEADALISSNVHAPSSGTVRKISEHPVPHPSGLSSPCIVIDTDGKEEWIERETHEDYLNLPREKVLEIVRRSGIAGMGGAGFPTDIKLHPANHKQLSALVINGIECEPYITADDMLMRTYADEMLRGIEIMARLLEPKEVILAIEDNKPEAYRAIQAALSERSRHNTAQHHKIELAVVPTKYPSGGEKQLIYILTGQEVPSGGIPADIGIVCQNVATARSVYRAVRYGEPLLSRITTLTGEQVQRPCNVDVLLGTPISYLIEQFGYTPAKTERIIIGGPMMGYTINDANTPVVKTTNCILMPAVQELPTNDQAQACIRCGLCTEACPADLLPQQLYWFARSHEYEKAEHHNLADCIECGACAYVCPSTIPLVQYYRHAKGEIKAKKKETEKSDQARIRFEARQARLEREAAEKEAKRKARAEAAAKLQAEKQAAANLASSAPQTDSEQVNSVAAKPSTAATVVPGQPTLEELQTNLEKAQSKLDKMIDALEDAKQSNPDNIAKLQRAVEKNQLRVNQAKQAFERAQAASLNAKSEDGNISAMASAKTTAPDISLEQLQVNVEKAQAKLEKMREALDNAKQNAPETVEKLERAVAKNETRLEAAKQALIEASGDSGENS